MTHIEREIRDMEVMIKCQKCCLSCEKYKTVKEQNKECEVRKARGRVVNREIYKARKKNKLKEG